jgi:transposase-like protein
MQLMRETGVTYKTAWRMFHQIRKLLAENISDLKGEVEADETYIGGKRRGDMSKRHKKVVGGAVERRGRVIAYHLPDNKLTSLIKPLRERVLPATVIFTDEAPQYGELKWLGYQHKRINHLARIYVDGDVHTQTIEGFWSLLKRGIGGVYHAVSAKHLQNYLNEYAFRYNHRSDGLPMFKTLLSQNASEVAASNQPRLDEQKPS